MPSACNATLASLHAIAAASACQAATARRTRTLAAALAGIAFAAWLPAAALAQAPAPNAVSGSAGLTGLYTFDSDLDSSGGSFRWSGAIASGSITTQINPQWSVGVNLGYQYEHWTFSSPSAFGSQAPWGTVNRPSVGFEVSWQMREDLGFLVAPQFEWAYETGANANAQNFGAVVGVTKAFSEKLVIGLGAGVFRQIDETKVFPFVIVEWQINDKWKLANPFRAGPAGGAGLELSYALDDKWELAGGGTIREYRFRLKDTGPNANGIGENSGIPLYARLSRKLGPVGRLDLYAGATVAGTLKLLDPNGSTIVSSDYNAAPFVALTLAADF